MLFLIISFSEFTEEDDKQILLWIGDHKLLDPHGQILWQNYVSIHELPYDWQIYRDRYVNYIKNLTSTETAHLFGNTSITSSSSKRERHIHRTLNYESEHKHDIQSPSRTSYPTRQPQSEPLTQPPTQPPSPSPSPSASPSPSPQPSDNDIIDLCTDETEVLDKEFIDEWKNAVLSLHQASGFSIPVVIHAIIVNNGSFQDARKYLIDGIIKEPTGNKWKQIGNKYLKYIIQSINHKYEYL